MEEGGRRKKEGFKRERPRFRANKSKDKGEDEGKDNDKGGQGQE
jgi:hypothetical protein